MTTRLLTDREWANYGPCKTCGAACGMACRTSGGGETMAHAGRPADRRGASPVELPSAITRQQRDILAHYFRGGTAEAIAKLVDCKVRTVVALIESIAYSKPQARQLVLAYDEARLNPLRAAMPVAPPNTYVPPPLPTITIRSSLEATMDTELMSTDTLLKTAEESGIPRAERLVKTIREKLTELAVLMEGTAEQRRLAAEVAALQKQLADKKAELAAANGKPAKAGVTPPSDDKRDSKAIRAWAAGRGISCPAMGRIPGYVLEAYDKAHASA